MEPSSSGKIETDKPIVSTDLRNTTDASFEMSSSGVKLDIAGNTGLGNIVVSAEQRTFTAAPNAAASFEITIVSSASYIADITVPAVIPYGYEVLAYYIDDNGNLVPIEVVGYTSSTVTFRTTHTTPFVIMAEEIVIPESPVEDDDDYPFIPGQGNNQGTIVTPSTPVDDSSDDNTKIVVAAAAIVVIMLAAVALMVNRNN